MLLELAAPPDAPDPPVAGNGPVVKALAILLAATFRRKLAAESPDVAIESVLIHSHLRHKLYPFIHRIGKIRRVVF